MPETFTVLPLPAFLSENAPLALATVRLSPAIKPPKLAAPVLSAAASAPS